MESKQANHGEQYLMFVATYKGERSQGIYVYKLDIASETLHFCSVAEDVENPSFLTAHPNGRYLYAVSEVMQPNGQADGFVTTFLIDAAEGGLKPLSQQSTRGANPCHLSLDRTSKYLLVANYGGGTISVLPCQQNGATQEATHVVQHEGASTGSERQWEPHPHSIQVAPDNRFAFVPDLGADKIMIYCFDLDSGKLRPNHIPWAEVPPGSGPRHLQIHPTGRFIYVINELNSTVTAFRYDSEHGSLNELQTVSTLPKYFDGANTCADIHVHPSGKFLYGSNRSHDSVVVFRINKATGQLSYIGHESTQGKTPRNFALDPSGTILLAGNQESDTIVMFQVDQETGELKPTGSVKEAPSPVCIKMVPIKDYL